MRVLILEYGKRPRPKLVTPAKGTLGDCTDETMAECTSLPSILARYGGNLAEIARWRGTMSYGDQPVDNLEDAIDKIKDAHDVLADLPNNPFGSLAEAYEAICNGTFEDMISGKVKEDEKSEDKSESVEKTVPPDSGKAASEE